MEILKLSKAGINQLQHFIEKKKKEIKAYAKEKADAYQGDTNSWHDNFPFEQARQKEDEGRKDLYNLIIMRDRCKLITPHGKRELVDLGDKVSAEMSYGKDEFVLTGKYSAESLNEITLNSPVGAAIYNKKAGEEFEYSVGDKSFKGKVLTITKQQELE